MRSVVSWMRKDRLPVILVFWSENEVHMGMGGIRTAAGPELTRMASLSPDTCTPENYRRAVSGLREGRKGRVPVYWVLLEEAYPPALKEGKEKPDMPLKLPDWMRWCWQSLMPEDLPSGVISAMAALDKTLGEHPGIVESGNGYYLKVQGNGLFLGWANERTVRRVTRRHFEVRNSTDLISDDWLRQTRTLFRNRTGGDLKRLYLESAENYTVSHMDSVPIELLPATLASSISSNSCGNDNAGVLMVLSSALKACNDKNCRLAFQTITRRIQFRRWERRFRVAASLLFCGWGFMLMNACRHEALMPNDNGAAGHAFTVEKSQILETRQKWERVRSEKVKRERPLHLAGIIAETVPREIQIQRLSMARMGSSKDQRYNFEIEGDVKGAEPSTIFRGWIEKLKSDKALQTVENLDLRRQRDDIAFVLKGISSEEGAGQ